MAVTVKRASEVSPSVKKMLAKAEAAVNQKNYGYASQILRGLLLAEPGLNEARLMLRQAQLERIAFTPKLMRQLGAMVKTAWAVLVKGPMLLKKGDMAKAFDVAEGAMEVDPTVLATLRFLARVAGSAELTDIAVNTLEVAARFHPKNKAVLLELAELYKKAEEPKKAMQILQKVMAIAPGDLQVQNELKHATALAAMQEARWQEAGSYRDVIKDKEQAQTLEQKQRVAARDDDTRQSLIAATLKDIAEQPTASKYRQLGELYRQAEDFDAAIAAFSKIPELTGTRDPAIDSLITDILRERYDKQIADLREQLDERPDDAAQIQPAITQLEAERRTELLQRYEARVENYPNEPRYRFELGLMYWENGRMDDAVGQLQLAQRHVSVQARAQLYMGKCLVAKGLLDMAIEQFDHALEQRERLSPKDVKDGLYDAALAHEAKGDMAQALARMKELYAMDVGYRDIAQRIERYYAAQRK